VKGIIAQAGLILGMLLLVTILLPPTGNSIRLALAGDIMLGRGVAQAHSDGDWNKALEAFASSFSRADFSFANLESPITEAPLAREAYDLRAPPQSIQSLSSSNISLLSLSNNHIADAGQKGIADTLNALASVGILPIGPSEDPVILQALRVDLAWFAYSDTNRDLDLEVIKQSLESVSDRVDYILVSIHWGNETKTVPNDRQRALAQKLADFGADIILGHHPHVLQPVERIWGEGRGRPTLVAYSLGNALFDQGAPPAARQAALLLLDLGPLSVKGACAVPFQMDPKTWNVIPASSSAEERIVSRLIVKTCINN
jgi:poly-gamma-glutamate synthesis protein (capsule biosynthesis protein)